MSFLRHGDRWTRSLRNAEGLCGVTGVILVLPALGNGGRKHAGQPRDGNNPIRHGGRNARSLADGEVVRQGLDDSRGGGTAWGKGASGVHGVQMPALTASSTQPAEVLAETQQHAI